MDVSKIIADLRRERDEIDAAIISLERLVEGKGQRRRGRPPAWLVDLRGTGKSPKSEPREPRNGRIEPPSADER